MSFRLRLTLLASLAVAVALVGASFVVYYTDRAELINQLDADLLATERLPPLAELLAAPKGAVTVVKGVGIAVKSRNTMVRAGGLLGASAGGALRLAYGTKTIVPPHSATAVQVRLGPFRAKNVAALAASPPPQIRTELLQGAPVRALSFTVAGEAKVEVTGSLVDVDRNLAHLRFLLLLICLGGIGAAAVLGGLVSHTAVAPLRRLTRTTERIVETGDLSERTGQRGRDEVSRLSSRLDELLANLEGSLETQRRLVADASHELRTPIATLRANVELLAEPGRLDPGERAEVAADVRDELEAMTTLVGELVELARGEEPDVAPCEFRLDQLVSSVVERVARRAPGLVFETRLEPTSVRGIPERVERAVANLLDNARKWSPPGGTVEVSVSDGAVSVRDHGPGIDSEDLPYVFNRFYRSTQARGMPGAGLGLAIVKQIADAHGGGVAIDSAPGGGTVVRLALPRGV